MQLICVELSPLPKQQMPRRKFFTCDGTENEMWGQWVPLAIFVIGIVLLFIGGGLKVKENKFYASHVSTQDYFCSYYQADGFALGGCVNSTAVYDNCETVRYQSYFYPLIGRCESDGLNCPYIRDANMKLIQYFCYSVNTTVTVSRTEVVQCNVLDRNCQVSFNSTTVSQQVWYNTDNIESYTYSAPDVADWLLVAGGCMEWFILITAIMLLIVFKPWRTSKA